MEENINRLKSYGLNSVYLGESNRSLKEEILTCKYNYIFGAPESLTGDGYFADIFKNSAFCWLLTKVTVCYPIKRPYIFLLPLLLGVWDVKTICGR